MRVNSICDKDVSPDVLIHPYSIPCAAPVIDFIPSGACRVRFYKTTETDIFAENCAAQFRTDQFL